MEWLFFSSSSSPFNDKSRAMTRCRLINEPRHARERDNHSICQNRFAIIEEQKTVVAAAAVDNRRKTESSSSSSEPAEAKYPFFYFPLRQRRLRSLSLSVSLFSRIPGSFSSLFCRLGRCAIICREQKQTKAKKSASSSER